jgi:predicted RNA-binding protein with EMAP domain
MHVLETGKPMLQHQCQQTQETQLIWGSDHDPTSDFYETDKFTHQATRIFQMLYGFNRGDYIRTFIGQRHTVRVQMNLTESSFRGKIGIAYRVSADVAGEVGSQKWPDVARTTADVNDKISAVIALIKSSCHHFIDWDIANAERLSRTRVNHLTIGA